VPEIWYSFHSNIGSGPSGNDLDDARQFGGTRHSERRSGGVSHAEDDGAPPMPIASSRTAASENPDFVEERAKAYNVVCPLAYIFNGPQMNLNKHR
jgi:hypothetical protein